MRKYLYLILIAGSAILAETLFEVKDASNNKVLDVSTDGLRIMNQGDTLMVISSDEIKANLSTAKGLSRSFSVTTNSSKGSGVDLMRLTSDSTRFWISDTGSGFGVSSQTALKEKSVATNFLKVSNANTEMREGTAGERYTDFSPQNIFLGLSAGANTDPDTGTSKGIDNVFVGNQSGLSNHLGISNVFIGKDAGYSNIGDGTFLNGEKNVFIGLSAGYSNTSGACNVFVGKDAGKGNLSGIHNICIGTQAGWENEEGSENVFIGGLSAFNGSGTGNVYLGYISGMRATGDNNVLIGYRAGENLTGSNKLYIENSDSSYPLIYGEFDSDSVKINGNFNVSGNSNVEGNLGVGVKPLYKIHSEDITTTSDNPAIFGRHNITDTWGVGVRGEGGARGVEGYASATADYHIHGISGSASGSGGVRTGVYGTASGGTTNWAGYFSGNVRVTGTINPTKVDIKIDHPSDPENKILSHSSVNSSEMLNVYNGNVILDSEGKAFVSLPEWFEAFNTDFRYQLTPVGAYAQLYISEEISENKFEISGGKPGLKVSWQVTGTRNDNYAKANPMQVVTEKKENEKGYYLTPEVFGRSKDRSIESIYEKESERGREK